MTAVDHLKQQAEFAWTELSSVLEGVTQGQAWSVLPDAGMDYLHSDASIQGITLHIATGKLMYASSAFLDGKYRWREVADELESFEPDWPSALEFLRRAHEVWMASWANLSDADLEKDVADIRGRMVPAYKIIRVVSHHDGWHGGQIAMLRYGVGTSETPPPSQAADIRQYCAELPLW